MYLGHSLSFSFFFWHLKYPVTARALRCQTGPDTQSALMKERAVHSSHLLLICSACAQPGALGRALCGQMSVFALARLRGIQHCKSVRSTKVFIPLFFFHLPPNIVFSHIPDCDSSALALGFHCSRYPSVCKAALQQGKRRAGEHLGLNLSELPPRLARPPAFAVS